MVILRTGTAPLMVQAVLALTRRTHYRQPEAAADVTSHPFHEVL